MAEENTDKEPTGVYLSKNYKEKLVAIAKKNRRSLSTEAAIRLEKSIDDEEKKKKE
jgi:hypothetical protein